MKMGQILKFSIQKGEGINRTKKKTILVAKITLMKINKMVVDNQAANRMLIGEMG